MAIVVELPRLSDTMEEGVIAKWHVSVGDKVRRGQVIADIETDKATMEFESFDAGQVLKLVAPEGETLPLGAPIAVLGNPGEDAEAALAGRGGGGAKPSAPAPANAASPGPSGPTAGANEPPPAKASPAASTAPTASAAPATSAAASHGNGRVPASPLARRLANEHGIELSQIPGSGPHGRVVKVDVEAAAREQTTGAKSARAGTPTGDTDRHGRPYAHRPDNEVKLSLMRKTIAKRMTQSKPGAPQFYLTSEIDMTGAADLRAQVNEAQNETKVSYNDILVLACGRVLRDHPHVNAYYDSDRRIEFGDVHVGVAVAIEDGLVVPVVRHTDQKGLVAISLEVRELGRKAKDKKLTPEQMTGSTFTVSNLGMFGVDQFTAIVNPGEGAILAVGGIEEKPVVIDGQIVIRKRMRVTLSCDHRAMDGADGARFLQALKRALEQPLALLA